MKMSLDLIKNFGKVSFAFVFTLLAVVASAQEAEIKSALRSIEQDKKKQAIETLQKAIVTYPAAAQLYYHLGHAQLVSKDQAAAKESFDKGVAANPKEPLNYVGQGHILVLEKKSAQAKPLFDRALGFGKKNIATLQAIGEAELADKATVKDALALLTRAKELDANDFNTLLLLGDAYMTENQGGSCASAYEDAATKNPKSAAPWYRHSQLFMRSKNIPIVEEDLLKAVAIDPEFALAHKELARLYYLKKEGATAVKHYQAYLKLTDSPEKDYQLLNGFYLFMAKDYTKANEEFKALSQKPNVTPTLLRYYAKSLYEADNLAESQKIFEQYLSSKKDSLKASDYSNYAELLQKQKKDSLAALAFHKSLELDKNQPKVLEILVKYYFQTKKYNQCSTMSRALISTRKVALAPDYYTFGRSLYFEQKYPQADSAFAKLIELQPKITLGYLWAARSKAAQDEELKDALAKPYYEKVIEIGSATPEKNKNDLIAAYQYMGSYHLLKQENQIAKGYFEKVLALNPEDERSKEAIKLINTPVPQNPPKRK